MTTPHHYFLRHSKLSLPFASHAEMPISVLHELATGVMNPPIDEEYTRACIVARAATFPFAHIERMVVSPSERTQTTAELIQEYCARNLNRTIPVTVCDDAREVSFDLHGLTRDISSTHLPIEEINERVLRGVIEGIHCEPLARVNERIDRVHAELEKNAGSTLVITHAYFMRVMEARLKTQRTAIDSEAILATRRYSYLEGYTTSATHTDLEYIPYTK